MEMSTHDSQGTIAPLRWLRIRLDAIYTPLDVALAELLQRRRSGTNRATHDWLNGVLAPCEPGYAFLFRFIATPNFETQRFLDLTAGTGLLPVIGEYGRDRFTSCNPVKRALGRLGFMQTLKPGEPPFVEYVNVMSWRHQGQCLYDLKTRWGQNLALFHRELLCHVLDGHGHPIIHDFSPQYARAGAPAAYYRHIFSACITNGILFENFMLDDTELNFTRDVVLPAYDDTVAQYGAKPLIVRLCPKDTEASQHWYWYPNDLKAFVSQG